MSFCVLSPVQAYLDSFPHPFVHSRKKELTLQQIKLNLFGEIGAKEYFNIRIWGYACLKFWQINDKQNTVEIQPGKLQPFPKFQEEWTIPPLEVNHSTLEMAHNYMYLAIIKKLFPSQVPTLLLIILKRLSPV